MESSRSEIHLETHGSTRVALNPAELTGQSIWNRICCLNFAQPPTQPSLGSIIVGGNYEGGARHGRINHDYTSGALIPSTADGQYIIVDGKTTIDR